MDLLEYIETRKNKVGKVKKAMLKDMLMSLEINILSTMFKYGNLPDSIPQEFLEKYFICDGSIGGWRLDKTGERYAGEVIVTKMEEGDAPDVYGIGQKYICTTENGYVKMFKYDEEIAVGYNNSIRRSDMLFLNIIADAFVEVITSINSNVTYARLKPVFRVDDNKIKVAIEEAFKKINDDEPLVVTSQNVMRRLLDDGKSEDIDVLNITDPVNADKIQYLTKLMDDIMRWAFGLYGQAIQGNGKQAQLTEAEANGNTSTSFILPNDRLRMRRKFVDELNSKFGLDVTVDFSDAWKVEEVKYMEEADVNKDGELEEIGNTEMEGDTDNESEPEENVSRETSEEKEDEKDEETVSD